MAKSVLERMLLNDMVYIPPNIVHGRHVFFAIDNVDFGEDTPDGKRTLHATAMAIYQTCEPDDQELKLNLIGLAQKRSNKELSLSMPELLECPKPAAKPQSPAYPSFSLMTDEEPLKHPGLPDFSWLLGRTLARSKAIGRDVVMTMEVN